MDAGLPNTGGINRSGGQQNPGAVRSQLRQGAEDIEGGASFAEALAKHPKSFSRLYVNMVAAGETGGVLDTRLPVTRGGMPFIVQTTVESTSRPVMPPAPSRPYSLVRPAAWAIGADPWPASLEYSPRRTPHMITVIRPPQPALREKASVNMAAKLGRMASGRDRKTNMALPM